MILLTYSQLKELAGKPIPPRWDILRDLTLPLHKELAAIRSNSKILTCAKYGMYKEITQINILSRPKKYMKILC